MFTADSWKAYAKALAAAQKKYDDAVADTLGQIDAATSAEIVTDLNEAWAGLQFKNQSGQTVEGDAGNQVPAVVNVHRLSKGGEHFYSSDEKEIAALTSTISTSGNWTDEGNLLYGLVAEADKFATFDTAVEQAYKAADNPAAHAQVLAELSAAATRSRSCPSSTAGRTKAPPSSPTKNRCSRLSMGRRLRQSRSTSHSYNPYVGRWHRHCGDGRGYA